MIRAALLAVACLLCLDGAARALPPPEPRAAPLIQLIARGDAALRAGDSISAIGFYRDAVSRAPRDPRGYAALGRGYLAVGEAEHAREAFETGVRHTPGSQALALGLIEAYERLGLLARALEAARALRRDAEDPLSAYEALARLAERTGAFTEALAARRAKLARLTGEDEAGRAAREEERLRARALELLLGESDRLGRGRCALREESVVLAALLRCDARAGD